MPLTKDGTLSACEISTNCELVEWGFKDVNIAFKKLRSIAIQIPRTETLEESKDYWHGLCRSLVFRFPDDLEILKLSRRGIIQIRSASRIGVSDMGVNKNRIQKIYKEIKDLDL